VYHLKLILDEELQEESQKNLLSDQIHEHSQSCNCKRYLDLSKEETLDKRF